MLKITENLKLLSTYKDSEKGELLLVSLNGSIGVMWKSSAECLEEGTFPVGLMLPSHGTFELTEECFDNFKSLKKKLNDI